MIRIRHILFPTDFSESADRALDHAAALARRYGARLTLFHVVVPYTGGPVESGETFPGQKRLDEIFEELERDAHEGLEQRIAERAQGFDAERVVARAFDVADKILSYADAQDVDLIVMGSHGRRGVPRLLLGSEAERVVRLASCPVLAVSSKSRIDHHDPTKILVPIDFSAASEQALRYGLALGKEFGAEVHVAHVFDEPVVPPFLMDHTASFIHTDPKMKERCLASMDEHLARYDVGSTKVHKHVLEGRVATTVRDFADSENADLVVIGTRGLKGLDTLLLGSTAAHVIRTAHCPVLTVREQEREIVE